MNRIFANIQPSWAYNYIFLLIKFFGPMWRTLCSTTANNNFRCLHFHNIMLNFKRKIIISFLSVLSDRKGQFVQARNMMTADVSMPAYNPRSSIWPNLKKREWQMLCLKLRRIEDQRQYIYSHWLKKIQIKGPYVDICYKQFRSATKKLCSILRQTLLFGNRSTSAHPLPTEP